MERAEGMVTLDEICSTVADAEGIMSSIAQYLDGVAAALVAMSEAIEHPNAGLDWGPIDALETQMADLDDIMGTILKVESYDAVATLRPMVEGQRHLATTTALLASEWRDGTNPPTTERSPRLAPKDEVRARDRVREAPRTLVSNLTLQSAVMRHAIRYGATSTVGGGPGDVASSGEGLLGADHHRGGAAPVRGDDLAADRLAMRGDDVGGGRRRRHPAGGGQLGVPDRHHVRVGHAHLFVDVAQLRVGRGLSHADGHRVDLQRPAGGLGPGRPPNAQYADRRRPGPARWLSAVAES